MLATLVSRLPSHVRRQIENRITLLRAAENTGWIIANNFVRLGISMVVGIWVARYLGVVQYGIFNYVLSLNMLLRTFIPLGTGNLLLRDLARSHEERNTIMGSAFFVQLLLSGVMLIVAVGLALFAQQGDPDSQKFTLILSVLLLLTPFDVVGPWFHSQLQAVKPLIANTTSLLLMAIARVWLVQVEASLDAFIYLLIAERVVNILTLLYLYQRSGESIWRWNFELKRAWNTTREGMPFFWSLMARSVYTRGNEIMLIALANAAAVGYFVAANKIFELYAILPMAIVASATPIISKSKIQDQSLYLTQLARLLRVTSAIGIGSTIIVSLIAQWLMPFIYGEEFAGASPVLAIIMWGAIPGTLNMITPLWVVNEGLAQIQLQKVLAMAGLIALLNWLLIPPYGATGAAISRLVATSLIFIVWDFVDPRMRNFGFLKLHALFPWWFRLKTA